MTLEPVPPAHRTTLEEAQLARTQEALAAEASLALHRSRHAVTRAQVELARATELRRAAVNAREPVVYLLEEDPDLAEGLSEVDRRAAHELLRVPVLRADSRRWDPPRCDPRACFGLLVLDGLLGRRVRVGSAVATELLTCGDIVRPWDRPMAGTLLAGTEDWRVFQPVRLAFLDQRVTELMGRRPQLMVSFSERLLRRARATAYLMAMSHLVRVEDKLLGTLWHLASRCGYVTPQGVTLPLGLSHEVLGEIVGARRPSVTAAISGLQQRAQLARNSRREYVLIGDPSEWDQRA